MTRLLLDNRPGVTSVQMLVGLNMLAIASLYGLPVEQLAPAGELPVPLLRLAAMLQPLLLTLLAIWLGQRFAPRLDLGLPLLTACAEGKPVWPMLQPLLPIIAAASLAVGLLLVGWSWFIVPQLGMADSTLANLAMPLLTRLFYGGIGEEVLMRWGLLSAVAAAGLRLGLARGPALVTAALLSSLLFGAGHLPLLGLLAHDPPAWAATAVVLGNALPGMIFAGLFITYGLESAMLAHAGAHLIGWVLA